MIYLRYIFRLFDISGLTYHYLDNHATNLALPSVETRLHSLQNLIISIEEAIAKTMRRNYQTKRTEDNQIKRIDYYLNKSIIILEIGMIGIE